MIAIEKQRKKRVQWEALLCQNFRNSVIHLKRCNQFKCDFMLLHIPNEQLSGTNENYKKFLGRMGVISGAADYCIISVNGKASFLEFKKDSKGKLSTRQKAFKEQCEELNIPYKMVWTVEQGIDFIKENI